MSALNTLRRAYRRLRRPLWRVTGFAVILVSLNGCATGSPGSFCAIYEPVYTVADDTAETRDAVDRNNAVWLELCGNA